VCVCYVVGDGEVHSMGPAVGGARGEIYAVNAWTSDTLLRVHLPRSICRLMDNDEAECRASHGCLWCINDTRNETYCLPADTQPPLPGYACLLTTVVK